MKNTFKILAVCAILGALLVGCSPSPEGNNDAGSTNKTSADVKSNSTATPDAPVGNTTAPAGTDTNKPAGDTKAPAGDSKAPAGDSKAPAGDTNKPADPAAATNK